MFLFSENESIFNVIIENRLARSSLSSSLLYCIKLRDMSDETGSTSNYVNSDVSLFPPKRARLCHDDVFLAPLNSITPPPILDNSGQGDDKSQNQLNSNTGKMQIVLPTVPCLSPTSIVGKHSLSTLTSHLSQPPLQIPQLSFETSQASLGMSTPYSIYNSMPDISALITKQNGINTSLTSVPSFIRSTIESSASLIDSTGKVNRTNENLIKLPINLSTLVPVSKQSLNLDNMEAKIPTIPVTTSTYNGGVNAKFSQSMPAFSLNALTTLSPLSPAISPQISSASPKGSMTLPLACPATIKDSRLSNTSKRSRLNLNNGSSCTTLVWPGVDVIVGSYRKYDQGKMQGSIF